MVATLVVLFLHSTLLKLELDWMGGGVKKLFGVQILTLESKTMQDFRVVVELYHRFNSALYCHQQVKDATPLNSKVKLCQSRDL